MTRPLAALAVLLLVVGCATSPSRSPSGPSPAPRARCLVDPNETGLRPLVFLFCIESP